MTNSLQRRTDLDLHPEIHRMCAQDALPLICFSHLRWGFVWQRPQHLLTRFAELHPVYVVEEPITRDGNVSPHLAVTCDAGVTVITPILPGLAYSYGGFCARNNNAIADLLSAYFLDELSGLDVIAWYYTPMALGALPEELNPSIIIYDAMDELSNFRGAPKALHDRERQLMQASDLVFAGGPSLHEARKFRHPRAFCFPSGVDAAHFTSDGSPCPADIAHLDSFVAGFYGVIDERIDLDLLANVADARPEWTIMMIGPVAKIDESDLPKRSNIHYLGMRSYEELPQYLARFDVAILPFAINEATRFISPTKTLEYLAGGKPVVSTAIRDVVDLYGEVVEIATTPEEFVNAIERISQASVDDRMTLAKRVKRMLEQHDWNVIATGMHELINQVVNQRSTFSSMLKAGELPPIGRVLQETAD